MSWRCGAGGVIAEVGVAAGMVAGAAADGATGAGGMAAAGVIVGVGVAGVIGAPGPIVPIAAFMAGGDGPATVMDTAMAAAPMVGATPGDVLITAMVTVPRP